MKKDLLDGVDSSWKTFLAVGLIVIALLAAGSSQGRKKWGKANVGSPERSSRSVWVQTFPEKVKHAYLATQTGEVLVHSLNHVWLVGSNGVVSWTQGNGQGWNYICGAGIAADGSRSLFQTDTQPKQATNLLNLTVHYLDREGEVIWSNPNPYKYNSSQLSPSGKYIFFGDAFEKGARMFDEQFNLVWEKDLYLWYLIFDPLENYTYDAVDGLLFNMQGRQVFDFGARGNKIYGISDNAEVILVKQFLGPKRSEMFLMSKKMLKRVDFMGLGGGVSPDGSLIAVVTEKKKLKVFDTLQVLEAGNLDVEPLIQTGLARTQIMNFSRDNQTLFIKGDNMAGQLLMMIDLENKQILWKAPPPSGTTKVVPMQDNKNIMVLTDSSTVMMLKGR